MLDAEVAGGDCAQAAEHRFEAAARVVGIDDNVGGERVVALGDGPDVHVVNLDDAFHALQLAAETGHVDMVGGAFEQNVDDLGEQAPRAEQDQDTDDHAQDGVGEGPPEGPDQHARHDDADRAQQVGHHVPEGAFDVDAVPR